MPNKLLVTGSLAVQEILTIKSKCFWCNANHLCTGDHVFTNHIFWFYWGGWAKYFTDHTKWVYMIVYTICVIAFTFLYTALIFNPKQMAEDLKRNNGFIPGVKPGQPTADYIGTIMDRITLPGAVLLAFVGILPGIFQLVFKTQQGFATFYGGTSLLIMVAVIFDTLQQIETQLLMRQYDGLMSTGRIQGRQTSSAVSSGI